MYHEEPFYKRTILPWYQSNSVSIIIIMIMSGLIAFSIIGIQVANTLPVWYKLKGIPYSLLILSVLFLVIYLGRIVHAKIQRLSKSKKW
jgi:uncharacterized protein (DUF983 family)